MASPSRLHTPEPAGATDVLTFWSHAGPARWFKKDAAFDTQFRSRFLEAHEAAARGELASWANTAGGALALVILLDQFPRNSFRDTPRMFATDPLARDVARKALRERFDQQVDAQLRSFFYMPFMHSEVLADQEVCVDLMLTQGEDSRKFAVLHRDIIKRFGRFPHRNAILGRGITPEEQRFLDEGGFAG